MYKILAFTTTDEKPPQTHLYFFRNGKHSPLFQKSNPPKKLRIEISANAKTLSIM